MQTLKLHSSIKNVPPRGGSSVVESSNHVVIFGGTDREQCSYQDLIVYARSTSSKKSANLFEKLGSTEGDTPMPRSGHALTSYGKYVFLFGGIDFSEEAVFNDLYLLNTESMEWSYVGESGEEICGRNSHSLCILQNNQNEHYIIIFGGASPEHGTLGDVYYAKLPPVEEIDPKTIFVTWQTATFLKEDPAPEAREMHSTSSVGGALFIAGGRNMEGQMLDDVWMLSFSSVTNEDTQQLRWNRLADLTLPQGRCSHGSVLLHNTIDDVIERDTIPLSYIIHAGITMQGISQDIIRTDLVLHKDTTTTTIEVVRPWSTVVDSSASSSKSSLIAGRFGHSVSSISKEAIQDIITNNRYQPIVPANVKEFVNNHPIIGGAIIFGGVDVDKDYGDIWLVLFSQR